MVPPDSHLAMKRAEFGGGGVIAMGGYGAFVYACVYVCVSKHSQHRPAGLLSPYMHIPPPS